MSRLAMLLVTISFILGFDLVALGQDDALSATENAVGLEAPLSVDMALQSPLRPRSRRKRVSSPDTLPPACSMAWLNRTTPRSRPPVYSHHACNAHHRDRFAKRPFGDALAVTMSAQVNRGAQDTVMLYYYDFYPRGSKREAELTPRGQLQLSKFVNRMPLAGWPIQIQIQTTEHDPELNQERRQHVVEELALQGLEAPDQFVVFGRQKYGVPATDALQNAENLSQSAKMRGRTIRAGESAKFGQ